MLRWTLIAILWLGATAAQAQESDAAPQPTDPGQLWTGYAAITLGPDGASWAEDRLLEDDLIYSAEIALARTGRLTDPLDLGWSGGFTRELPAGTPVYGRTIPGSYGRGAQLVWCVMGGSQPVNVFTSPTACLRRDGDNGIVATWMEPSETPFALHRRTGRDRTRRRPGIAEIPGALPPLYTETLHFDGLEGASVIVTTWRRSGEIEYQQGRQQLPLNEAGQAIVRQYGGAWRLTPDENDEAGLAVEMLSAPLPPEAYATAYGNYIRFMIERVGSVDWIANRPPQPSTFDMARDGFIWNESTPEDGRRLRDTPLLPAIDAPSTDEAAVAARQAYSATEGHVLLEITDAPVLMASGTATRGDVIAVHQLRVRNAITIDEPLQGINQSFEAGAVFGLLVLGAEHNTDEPPADMARLAWCDMQARRGFFSTGNLDCFIDRNGDGTLDLAVMGDPQNSGVGVTLGRLRERRDIEPHAYRKAEPENYPVAELGYRYCEGDNIAGPARFAPVYRAAGETGWSDTMPACSLGVWPDLNDHDRVEAGALVLAVEPADRGITFEVVERLQAEPVFVSGDGEPPAPIRELGTRVEQARAQRASLTASPLLATGTPDVREGDFSDHTPFASIPVRHGITGHLLNVVSQVSGWFRDDPLPVGTPVYGTPMGRFGNGRIIWCAPRPVENGRDTVCFPQSGNITYWVEPSGAFFNSGLQFTTDTPRASVPEVAEGPVDFDVDLRLEVNLQRWNRDNALLIARVCGGTDCGMARTFTARREGDGSVRVDVFGYRLSLSEVEGGNRRDVRVEIVSRPDDLYDPDFLGLLNEAMRSAPR